MACDTPFDALRLATESLGNDIFVLASWRDVWTNLIPKGTYPKGTGLVQSTFTVERSEPTDDLPDFVPIALSEDETYVGACNTVYQDVPIGMTERTYGPEQFGWKGPPVCQDDLIYNFNAERFFEKYIPAISKNTIRTIGNRLGAIYTHLVPKYVANEDFHVEDGGTGAPPKVPDLTLDESTCQLTQEMLDTAAQELMEEGATDIDSNGWISLGDEGPIFPLYIGMQASKNLQLNNAELRQDYRWADPMPLIKRMGATRIIGNFRHIINLFPPRYTYEGTKYVRVPTWTMPAATKGQKAVINPSWRTAPFEGAWILSPWVFHSEIVNPVNSAAGMSWSPKNYMGEWQFVRGGDNISTTKCFDPLEKLGAHFAEYKHAPRPIYPQFGRFIIFLRCPATYSCVTCS